LKSFGELLYEESKLPPRAAEKSRSHIPRIEAPERVRKGEPFEVKIVIGSHPQSLEHSIRWIELYLYEEGREFNPIYVARIELEPPYAEPFISLRLRLEKSGVLYVASYCSLHGVWVASRRIEVE